LLVHTTAGALQLVPFALSQHTPVAKVVQTCPAGDGVAVGELVGVALAAGVAVQGGPLQTPTAGLHD
jgi:hypothetical protein